MKRWILAVFVFSFIFIVGCTLEDGQNSKNSFTNGENEKIISDLKGDTDEKYERICGGPFPVKKCNDDFTFVQTCVIEIEGNKEWYDIDSCEYGCNPLTNECYKNSESVGKCFSGLKLNECSPTKPIKCSYSIEKKAFVEAEGCEMCGCPGGYSCDTRKLGLDSFEIYGGCYPSGGKGGCSFDPGVRCSNNWIQNCATEIGWIDSEYCINGCNSNTHSCFSGSS